MEYRFNKGLAIIALILAIILPACSARYDKYTSWDIDKNGKIERYEFSTGYKGANMFRTWAGSNFSFPVNEFVNSLFYSIDDDNDRELTRVEFKTAGRYLNFGFGLPGFKNFDNNANSVIDESEFKITAIEAVLRMWDISADGQISEHEMSTGLYRANDIDNNGTIEPREFSRWKSQRLTQL